MINDGSTATTTTASSTSSLFGSYGTLFFLLFRFDLVGVCMVMFCVFIEAPDIIPKIYILGVPKYVQCWIIHH